MEVIRLVTEVFSLAISENVVSGFSFCTVPSGFWR